MKTKFIHLAKEVLTNKEFQDEPPVLLDLGASGGIHKAWELLAPYSICLAFDADDRDFSDKINNSIFKKLHLINKIVSDKNAETIPFYLTYSPYCSSSLKPEDVAFEDWKFFKLFEIVKEIKLPNITLNQVLTDLNIKKIDWFKTDTQGTDLTLFKSLPVDIQQNIIVAEFEPGIIAAYKGEEKLHHVLAFMEQMPFWAMSIDVRGTQRISKATLNKYHLNHNSPLNIPPSSCWAEISYFNNFKSTRSNRDILLAWIIATVKGQHGFALDLLLNTTHTINTGILNKLISFSESEMIVHKQIYTVKQKIKNKLTEFIEKI